MDDLDDYARGNSTEHNGRKIQPLDRNTPLSDVGVTYSVFSDEGARDVARQSHPRRRGEWVHYVRQVVRRGATCDGSR